MDALKKTIFDMKMWLNALQNQVNWMALFWIEIGVPTVLRSISNRNSEFSRKNWGAVDAFFELKKIFRRFEHIKNQGFSLKIPDFVAGVPFGAFYASFG